MHGASRQANSETPAGFSLEAASRVSSNEARAAVEAVWRSESARIVGALARYTGDFPLAEDLNRAVAVAMAAGPAAGLKLVDSLAARGELEGSHLLPTVKGELLARLGCYADAKESLKLALDRCTNAAERTALERKIAQLGKS